MYRLKFAEKWQLTVGKIPKNHRCGPNNPVNTLCVSAFAKAPADLLPDFVFGPYKYLPAFVGAAYHAARPLRAFPTVSCY